METSCEEIKVAPHLSFELFIEDLPGSVPITFNYTKDGIQIYQNQRIGNWMITFNGQETIPAILKNYLKWLIYEWRNKQELQLFLLESY